MIKKVILASVFICIMTSCSQDCTKSIVRPAYQIGGAYYPQTEIKVPCDYNPGQIGKSIPHNKKELKP